MAFNDPNIDQFKSKFYLNGWDKPNRYEVVILGPSGYRASPSREVSEKLTFNCVNAVIPERSFGTFEVRTGGLVRKHPNDSIYQDVTLTFRMSQEMSEYTFFQDWMESSIYLTSENYFGYYDDYVGNVKITKYSDVVSTKRLKMWELHKAYPINIGEVALAYDSNDTISTFPVTFSYHHWTSEL